MNRKTYCNEPVNIGFDIGIASVGWSVVNNKNGKILETGVSIFPSASASRNVERRGYRQARRLTRRRKNRIKDLCLFLKENGFPYEKDDQLANPYELRVKGLSEKLTEQELATALHHLVKRRGISYSLDDLEDGQENQTSYQQSIDKNQKLLKTMTPAEIQLERLEKFGKVRGQVKDSNTEDATTLMNVFPNSAYVDEARQILTTQAAFYPAITPEFIEGVLEILSRKREYFVGPGSEKSRTDYGIYRTDGTQLDNLFEILIGKDKIFPDEYRAAGNSYTAQLYNLLNDLNNLRIKTLEDGKLSKEQKEAIIQELKTSTKQVNMMKLIKKVANASDTDISGYRIDRKDKPEIHSMAIYRSIRKKFLESDIDINDWNTDFLDELGRILTINTEAGEIRRALTEDLQPKYLLLTDSIIEKILENKDHFKLTSNNKWHRFSLKTMKLLIPEMLHTSKEQMTILTELGMLHENKRDYKEAKKIDVKNLTENIYNPIVRKSVKQAMDIFNTLFERYTNITYLVIEMPRDDAENEIEAKKNIQKFQKENETEKEAALKEFQQMANISDSSLKNRLYNRRKLKTKIRLWYQQQGKCPYSGKTILADDLFTSDHLFEIDHIIPLSVSYDDGQNNKVLCFAEMNQEKGQRTPYGFMQTGKGQGFTAMQAMITKNPRMTPAKKRNLLFTEDINNIEVRKRFIARNLVDTRYASRVVLNELQQFVRSKSLATKVTVIRGKLTSKLRETWHITKTRETHHHHAIDATVIAVSPMLRLWERNTVIIPLKVNENIVDLKTGEILDDATYQKEMYDLPYANFLDQFTRIEDQIKFHHQVDKKMNRKVSDATIYATRSAMIGKDKKPEDYVLGKIKDIYEQKDYAAFKKIYDKDKTKFLMQQLDPKTFEKLVKIMTDYPEYTEITQDNGKVKRVDISPFELYRQEHGPVTKYAKKNNGPAIKSLKYYDSKIGSSIDITPKNAKNKKVILQSLKPWRTDVYFNHQTGEYEIMGLKYSDLCFVKGTKGKYGILSERYEEIKKTEGVAEDSEFLMSLYRGDRVKIIDTENGQSLELLFGSRTNPSVKGYVELKPIEKVQFDSKEIVGFYGQVSNGRLIKKFTRKSYRILKTNTTILGDPYYISKESSKPKNIIDTAYATC